MEGPARIDRVLLWATVAAWAVLAYLTWYPIPFTGWPAPDWSASPDVTAPLTRKLLFYHPAMAWAALGAYTLVLGASIAYLNERSIRFDRAARAAAEVGFAFNTGALVTGTLWGLDEWNRTGQSGLATIYTDPKVLVFLVLWLAFAAYLLLRRLVDGQERRARLAAAFGVLGFLGVPMSWLTSRIAATSLHPDVIGPGKNPDAALSEPIAIVFGWSFLAFTLLLLYLWRRRWRIERNAAALDLEEAQQEALLAQ